MAEYRFHVMGDDRVYFDETGQRFDAPELAIAHAAVIAGELAAGDDQYENFVVSVIDDRAREVARVPVVPAG
jgi:hypothetical protein